MCAGLEKRKDYIYNISFVIIIMWRVIVAVGRRKWSMIWSEAGEPA